jgi:UDP-N-acetyl-2-amino-2-deoxyglucuronate dehydrogenase
MKRFAIVGCGHISKRHAENISRTGQLVAVCDIVPERADALAASYSAKAYYSIEDLLASETPIDIVCVCTPNGLHAEHSIKSLQAGKHVLCEKPLCLTKAAAWQLIETEKFCRRKLFVVKSARYNPLLQELKDLLDDKSLGKVYSFHLSCIWNRPDEYYTDWRGKLFPDGGTLYNQFSHYIDAMLWLFGDVAEAKGFKANAAHQKSIEFEDTGAVSLLMESGALGTFHWSVNAFQKNYEIALTIVAEGGTIRIGGEYLNDVQFLQTENAILKAATINEGGAGLKPSPGTHDKMYDHLNTALEGHRSGFPDAYEGLKTVETIEKIYKAVSL